MPETSTTKRPIHQSGDRQPIRHIAVCIDRSPIGDSAMPHAAVVARAFDARLTLLHVLEPLHDGLRAALTDPLDWEVQRTEAQRHLESLLSGYVGVEPDGGPELTNVVAEVLEGRPAESIRHWVRSQDVDLTVLSSHGERGRTDWALASTARKLVEGVRGSVLLVPAHQFAKPSTEAATYRRVLVPLDGSARAESALAVADRIARSEGSEIVLLHVVPDPPHPCPGPLDDQERDLDRRLVDRNVRAATAYLKGVARRLEGDGIRVQTQVEVDSDVRDEIQHRIDLNDVDLVVLSGHGHGGRAQQPVGSVARLLIEHLTAPLLIVRDSSPPDPPTGPDARSQAGVRLPHATDG
ncbi:MAG: universal stress protein [Acidimicrobiia bacterium]|nr:universal stress protein [Acidimicrobiia bacterium]